MADVRYTNYYVIKDDPNKWSTNWSRFAGPPFAFQFELSMKNHLDHYHRWMQNNWHISIWISCLYVALIFALKKMMENRKPMHLRKALAVWSGSLTIFSVIGTIRCFPEFVEIILKKGFTRSFCESSYYEDPRLWAWYLIFTWSKAIELGDTVFIVLRKQKLPHLHWVHHVTTLIGSWYVIGDVPATARSAGNLNFLIHSYMYFYYTLKALQFRIPRSVSLFITTSQILQMMIGFYVNVKTFQFKMTGVVCDVSPTVSVVGIVVYALFFVLFANFFIRTYFVKKYSIQFDVTISKSKQFNSERRYVQDTINQIESEAFSSRSPDLKKRS